MLLNITLKIYRTFINKTLNSSASQKDSSPFSRNLFKSNSYLSSSFKSKFNIVFSPYSSLLSKESSIISSLLLFNEYFTISSLLLSNESSIVFSPLLFNEYSIVSSLFANDSYTISYFMFFNDYSTISSPLFFNKSLTIYSFMNSFIFFHYIHNFFFL